MSGHVLDGERGHLAREVRALADRIESVDLDDQQAVLAVVDEADGLADRLGDLASAQFKAVAL